ncbi:hypothetical protein IAT38_006394 [Cryptococcus sp. DSM 104549]
MSLSTAQIVILCMVALFVLIVLAVLCFALHSTRRAHKDNHAARTAVLGRWKDIGHMVVKGVPRPAPRGGGAESPLATPPGVRDPELGGGGSEGGGGGGRPSAPRRLSGIAGIGVPSARGAAGTGPVPGYGPLTPPMAIPGAREGARGSSRGRGRGHQRGLLVRRMGGAKRGKAIRPWWVG